MRMPRKPLRARAALRVASSILVDVTIHRRPRIIEGACPTVNEVLRREGKAAKRTMKSARR
jgi:hypothetical protein